MRGVSWFLFVVLVAFPSLSKAADFGSSVFISAKDQKLALYEDGEIIAKYPISTSKFGLGDSYGSYKTPLGALWVCHKIGENLPLGAVLHHRNATGEILKPNAPGRDPIVTRVLWLKGMEAQNRNAFARCIYIHGTTEERNLGKPVSFGCIRMRSKDVADLYKRVQIGTQIRISDRSLSSMLPADRKGWLATALGKTSPSVAQHF